MTDPVADETWRPHRRERGSSFIQTRARWILDGKGHAGCSILQQRPPPHQSARQRLLTAPPGSLDPWGLLSLGSACGRQRQEVGGGKEVRVFLPCALPTSPLSLPPQLWPRAPLPPCSSQQAPVSPGGVAAPQGFPGHPDLPLGSPTRPSPP